MFYYHFLKRPKQFLERDTFAKFMDTQGRGEDKQRSWAHGCSAVAWEPECFKLCSWPFFNRTLRNMPRPQPRLDELVPMRGKCIIYACWIGLHGTPMFHSFICSFIDSLPQTEGRHRQRKKGICSLINLHRDGANKDQGTEDEANPTWFSGVGRLPHSSYVSQPMWGMRAPPPPRGTAPFHVHVPYSAGAKARASEAHSRVQNSDCVIMSLT